MLLFFLNYWGGAGGKQTWEDWKVNVIQVYDVKLQENKDVGGKKIQDVRKGVNRKTF